MQGPSSVAVPITPLLRLWHGSGAPSAPSCSDQRSTSTQLVQLMGTAAHEHRHCCLPRTSTCPVPTMAHRLSLGTPQAGDEDSPSVSPNTAPENITQGVPWERGLPVAPSTLAPSATSHKVFQGSGRTGMKSCHFPGTAFIYGFCCLMSRRQGVLYPQPLFPKNRNKQDFLGC